MPESSAPTAAPAAPSRWASAGLLRVLAPLLVLGVALSSLAAARPGLGSGAAAPTEALTVNRISVPQPDRIVVEVTNAGAESVTIAQVQVDAAYWMFTADPSASIPPSGSATITIPYPWVRDEAHVVRLVSSDGVTFDGFIAPR